jgi:putative spermidine/putrescine transport system substrate-binding protein
MVTLMRTGRYDGVSASGQRVGEADRGRRRRPDRHKTAHQLDSLSDQVKNQPYNSVDGKMYGARTATARTC